MKTLECAYCGAKFERQHKYGPKPKYCSAYHCDLAYDLRKAERDAK